MQPDASPLLEQLKDIHGAAPPGWWPPAPGWWFVALVVLAVLVYLARKALRRLAVRRRRRRWLDALDALNRRHDPVAHPGDFLAALNRLFRAVAVRAFPGTGALRLQGEEWVAFITAMMPDDPANDCLRALASGPYEFVPQFDAKKLNERARVWVTHYG
jgi:hypothetical protein